MNRKVPDTEPKANNNNIVQYFKNNRHTQQISTDDRIRLSKVPTNTHSNKRLRMLVLSE